MQYLDHIRVALFPSLWWYYYETIRKIGLDIVQWVPLSLTVSLSAVSAIPSAKITSHIRETKTFTKCTINFQHEELHWTLIICCTPLLYGIYKAPVHSKKCFSYCNFKEYLTFAYRMMYNECSMFDTKKQFFTFIWQGGKNSLCTSRDPVWTTSDVHTRNLQSIYISAI